MAEELGPILVSFGTVGADAVQNIIDDIAGSLFSLRGAAIAAGAAVGFFGAKALVGATKSAINFEDQMVEVQKVTNENVVAEVTDGIVELSNKVPVARKELAEIAATAGRMGIQSSAAIEQFTETVSKMTVATQLTADEASLAFARMLNLMDLAPEKTEELSAAVNALSNNVAANSSEIVEGTLRSAAAFDALGLTAPQILGVNAALIATSESASRAGTRARRLAQELSDPEKFQKVANAVSMLDLSQQDLGESAAALHGKLQTERQELSNLQGALANTENQMQSVKGSIDDVDDSIRQHRIQIMELGTETREHESAIRNLNAANEQQRSIISGINSEIEEERAAIDGLKASTEDERAAIAALNTEIQQHQFAINGVNAKIRDQQIVMAELSDDIREQQFALASLNDTIRQHRIEMGVTNNSIREQRIEMEETAIAIDELEDRIRDIREAAERGDRDLTAGEAEQIEQLKEQLRPLKDAREEQRDEMQKLQLERLKEQDSIADLQHESLKVKDTIADINDEKAKHADTVADLRLKVLRERDSIATLRDEQAKHRLAIQQTDQEIQKHKANIQSLVEERSKHQAIITENNAKIREHKAAISEVTAAQREHKNAIEELRLERLKLTDQLDGLEERRARQVEAIEEQQGEVQALEEAFAKMLQQMLKTGDAEDVARFFSLLGKALNDTGEAGQELREALGAASIQALALLAKNSDDVTESIRIANGQFEEATSLNKEFDDAIGTVGNRMKLLRNRISNVGLAIGNIMLPFVGRVVDKLAEWVASINRADQHMVGVIGTIGLLTLTVGGLSLALGAVLSVWGQISGATAPLSGGLASVKGAITGLTVASAGLAAVIALVAVAIIARWDEITKSVMANIRTLVPAFEELSEEIQKIETNAGPVFTFLGDAFEVFADVVAGAIDFSVTVLTTAVDTIVSTLSVVIALLRGDWQRAWELAGNFVGRTVDRIVGLFERWGLWETIKGALDAIVGVFEWFANILVGSSIIPDLVDDIIAEFGRLATALPGVINAAVDAAVSAFGDLVAETLAVLGDIREYLNTQFITDIKQALDGFASTVVPTMKQAGEDLVSAFTTAFEVGVDLTESFLDASRNAVNSVTAYLKSSGAEDVKAGVKALVGVMAEVFEASLDLNEAVGEAVIDLGEWLATDGANLIAESAKTTGRLYLEAFKASLDIGETLVSVTASVIGDVANYLRTRAVSDLASAVKWVARQSKKSFVTNFKFAQAVIGVLATLVTDLDSYLRDRASTLLKKAGKAAGRAVRDALIGVLDFATDAVGAITGTLGSVGRYLRTDAKTDLKNAGKAAGRAVRDALIAAFNFSVDVLNTLKSTIGDFVSYLKTDAKGDFKAAGKFAGEALKDALIAAFNFSVDAIETLKGVVQGVDNYLRTQAKADLEAAGGFIKDAIVAEWNDLKKLIVGKARIAITGVKNYFQSGQAKSDVTDAVDALVQLAVDEWEEFRDGVVGVSGWVQRTVRAIADFIINDAPGIIIGELEAFVELMIAPFKGFYEGLIGESIIPETFRDIKTFIVNFGPILKAAIKEQIGKWLGVFEDFKEDAFAEVEKLSDKVMEKFGQLSTKLVTEVLPNMVTNLIDELKRLLRRGKEIVGNLTDYIKRKFNQLFLDLVGKSIVPEMVSDILSEFAELKEGIKNRVRTGINKAKRWVTKTGGPNLRSAFKATMKGIKSTVSGWAEKINEVLQGVIDKSDKTQEETGAAQESIKELLDQQNRLSNANFGATDTGSSSSGGSTSTGGDFKDPTTELTEARVDAELDQYDRLQKELVRFSIVPDTVDAVLAEFARLQKRLAEKDITATVVERVEATRKPVKRDRRAEQAAPSQNFDITVHVDGGNEEVAREISQAIEREMRSNSLTGFVP